MRYFYAEWAWSEYQIIHFIKALPDQIRQSIDSKNYKIKAFLLFESQFSLLPQREPIKWLSVRHIYKTAKVLDEIFILISI